MKFNIPKPRITVRDPQVAPNVSVRGPGTRKVLPAPVPDPVDHALDDELPEFLTGSFMLPTPKPVRRTFAGKR